MLARHSFFFAASPPLALPPVQLAAAYSVGVLPFAQLGPVPMVIPTLVGKKHDQPEATTENADNVLLLDSIL
jgi:hypothetical protein